MPRCDAQLQLHQLCGVSPGLARTWGIVSGGLMTARGVLASLDSGLITSPHCEHEQIKSRVQPRILRQIGGLLQAEHTVRSPCISYWQIVKGDTHLGQPVKGYFTAVTLYPAAGM